MPNYCSNLLAVYDSDGNMHKLPSEFCFDDTDDDVTAGVVENGVLCFNKIIPIAEGDRTIETCNERWGTKWDAACGALLMDGLAQQFDTAWSPPSKVAQRLSELLPDKLVYLGFDESGNAFSGYSIYSAGNEVDGVSLDTSFSGMLGDAYQAEEHEVDVLVRFLFPPSADYADRVMRNYLRSLT